MRTNLDLLAVKRKKPANHIAWQRAFITQVSLILKLSKWTLAFKLN